MYAIFANESVGRLYIAGAIPGLLLASLFMITIFILCKRDPHYGPRASKTSWRSRLVSLKDVVPVVILAIIVLGGIWGGIFTANEAAGVGAVMALVIGLVLKRVNGKNIKNSLMETLTITAMIFAILIGAMIFNYFIVLTTIPSQLSQIVVSLGLPTIGVLIAILLVYAILGCVMDSFAMTVLTLPIFLPVLNTLGIDLIWFGVLFVVMIEMSAITPPVGINVFIVAGMIKEIPMYTIFRGILPFYLALVVCVILLIAIPQIALLLPNTMIK
jgi:tripartite ATP-independent transporter DctM subunit